MDKNLNTRELRITRTLRAPIQVVWEVFSNPEHLAIWWGPNDYTNTIHKMDFRNGGFWEMTMHDPDGTDYTYQSIFKEIIQFEKIVYEHANPHFISTITFQSASNQTVVEWMMIFDTEELREIVIKNYKADVGQTQNMNRLQAYVEAKIVK